MYRYIDDFSLERDETYQKIVNKLHDFLWRLSSKEDEELFLKMVKEVYLKYNEPIKAKEGIDIELLLSTIMALLIELTKEIERLEKIKINN